MMNTVALRDTISHRVVPEFGIDETTSMLPTRQSIDVGNSFVRLMPLQKGDHIKALPWAWSDTSVDVSDASYVYSVSNSDGFSTTTMTFDARAFAFDTMGTNVPRVDNNTRSRIDSMAILKAQASLNKQVASLPLLFAERKAALNTAKKYGTFILNNAITMQRKDVKRWLKAIKRQSNPQKLKTLANQIANSHLEFVFGVLPLLDEIQSTVHHFSKPRVNVRTGRGRDRLVVENDSSYDALLDRNVSNQLFVRRKVTALADYSVRCDLRCDITSHIANDASLLGFNPIYTWYDLTPLSFILGWFSNFNTWIQSLDPLVGLNYVTGSSSVMSRTATNVNASAVIKGVYPNLVQTASGNVTSSVEHVDFNRLVHEKYPGIQPLRLMDKTSLFTHAASVSLAIQRLVGKSERIIAQKPFKYRGPKPRNLPPIKYRKVII